MQSNAPEKSWCRVRDVQRHLDGGHALLRKLHSSEATDVRAGDVEFSFRVTISKEHDVYPIEIKRIQFPIRLAFSMTINKSQGQSFGRVGVYLDREVFSHGQLYVAVSRAKRKENLRLFVEGDPTRPRGNSIVRQAVRVRNVVLQEVINWTIPMIQFRPPTESPPFHIV